MSGYELLVLGGCWVITMLLFFANNYRKGRISSWLHVALLMVYVPGLMVFTAWDVINMGIFKFLIQIVLAVNIYFSLAWALRESPSD